MLATFNNDNNRKRLASFYSASKVSLVLLCGMLLIARPEISRSEDAVPVVEPAADLQELEPNDQIEPAELMGPPEPPT
ncbi:MAG: hypothetical protein JSW45_05530, partial [Thiotrichales bacterium]